MPDDVALLSLTHISGGLDLTKFPLDGPLPDLPPSNAAKARQALVVQTARDHNMTLRQIARHTAAGTGHRVIVGTAEYMADEMEKWLKEEAADGFNVVCNHYPKPFEDFCTEVVPLLQQRGVFRTEYEGKTLRENLGLKIPENRYTRSPLEGGFMKRRTLIGAAACGRRRPRQRGVRAERQREGPQDQPLHLAAGGAAAGLPGLAADRPAMAPARPRHRRQAAAAPGADRADLVQPRQVGRHDVAHGRPARALRSRRVRLLACSIRAPPRRATTSSATRTPSTTSSPRSSAPSSTRRSGARPSSRRRR